MNNIPQKLRKELAADATYKTCIRYGQLGHECSGRITFEHAIIHAGRQVQEAWAILPICAKGHSVDEWQDRGDYNHEIHEWIALSRASKQRILELSKAIDYIRRLGWLEAKYGVFQRKLPALKLFGSNIKNENIYRS